MTTLHNICRASNVNTNNCTKMFWPQNPKDTTWYRRHCARCWRWLSISLAEVASSCAELREELQHQSSGGVSVLGGAEKLGGGGGCGTTSGSIQLLITHLTGNKWEIFPVHFTPFDSEPPASVHIWTSLTLRCRWFMFLSAVQLMGPSVENSRG